MMDYSVEYEWKMHPALNAKDVETQCMLLTESGWTVLCSTAHNNGLFYILAKRRKTDNRVYDSSGEVWLNQQAMGSA